MDLSPQRYPHVCPSTMRRNPNAVMAPRLCESTVPPHGTFHISSLSTREPPSAE